MFKKKQFIQTSLRRMLTLSGEIVYILTQSVMCHSIVQDVVDFPMRMVDENKTCLNMNTGFSCYRFKEKQI